MVPQSSQNHDSLVAGLLSTRELFGGEIWCMWNILLTDLMHLNSYFFARMLLDVLISLRKFWFISALK